MSNNVIEVENLSKQYRLGTIGTGALKDDLNRWWHLARGKEDPFLKVGEANDRTTAGTSKFVWSLRDVGFNVEQGDAVGIIGRNGAGKSTLLKILSRVTAPTTGSVKIKGRVASLLEVGTGFHPELSGRENIFLNGAILGMRKEEVKRKFDEIVDFAGVERYIDTPVKRYSSGMYVRLAFGVAAHLESEILIVDEVLAVGDSEFQKKCIGKMGEVSKGEGRTVLFVSHNIASINALCNKGIMLQNGGLKFSGDIAEAIKVYQDSLKQKDSGKTATNYLAERNPDKDAQILRVTLLDEKGLSKEEFDVWDKVFVEIEFEVRAEGINNLTPIIGVEKDGIELFWTFASDTDERILHAWKPGRYTYRVQLFYPLKKGGYAVHAKLGRLRVGDMDSVSSALQFVVEEFSFDPTNLSYASTRGGVIPAVTEWKQIS